MIFLWEHLQEPLYFVGTFHVFLPDFFLEKPASHEQRPGLHVDAIDICPGAVEVRLYLL